MMHNLGIVPEDMDYLLPEFLLLSQDKKGCWCICLWQCRKQTLNSPEWAISIKIPKPLFYLILFSNDLKKWQWKTVPVASRSLETTSTERICDERKNTGTVGVCLGKGWSYRQVLTVMSRGRETVRRGVRSADKICFFFKRNWLLVWHVHFQV